MPPYNAARTLLTTGIADASLRSVAAGNARCTPPLASWAERSVCVAHIDAAPRVAALRRPRCTWRTRASTTTSPRSVRTTRGRRARRRIWTRRMTTGVVGARDGRAPGASPSRSDDSDELLGGGQTGRGCVGLGAGENGTGLRKHACCILQSHNHPARRGGSASQSTSGERWGAPPRAAMQTHRARGGRLFSDRPPVPASEFRRRQQQGDLSSSTLSCSALPSRPSRVVHTPFRELRAWPWRRSGRWNREPCCRAPCAPPP